MKIKKLRHGYNIKCTAGDFEMLKALATGQKPFGPAKTAHTKRTNETGGDLFRVDVDDSAKPARPNTFKPAA